MKSLKTIMVLILSGLFLFACNSPEAINRNADQGVAVPPANTNSGVTGDNSSSQANGNRTLEANPAATSEEGNQKDQNKNEGEAKNNSSVDVVALYNAQRCVTCHGPDGKGRAKGAPDFTDPQWEKQNSEAQMIQVIKQGKSPAMPAYGSVLSEADIKALVTHIRSFAK